MVEEIFTYEHWVHSPAGNVHFLLALFSLLSGPVLLLRRKAGLFHRLLGATYVVSMLAVNISALTMFQLGGVNLFHLFALISLASLLSGMVCISQAIRTRKLGWFEGHAHFMIWNYYGLVMAGAAQILSRTLPRLTGSFESVQLFWQWVMPASILVTLVLTLRCVPVMAARYAPRAPAP
jgi:uncharacterized membrane protein